MAGQPHAGKRRMAAGRPRRAPTVPRRSPARSRSTAGPRSTTSTIAYETWGTLDDDHSNAILLCHAWTGDSHAAGPMGHGHPTAPVVGGRGRPRAGDRHRSLVRRVRQRARRLPGLHRSGLAAPDRRQAVRQPVPGHHDPRHGARPDSGSPTTSAIAAWHSVIGGSMGGMQVLEWAITFPHRVRSIVPIATCAQATAQQIAWGAIGRRAIRIDPNWRGGDYYDADDRTTARGRALSVARMVAQVTFRSDNVFTDRFGRELADGATLRDSLDLWQRFEVERYLDHHGDKLVRRFDANSYLIIGKAMDLHDVGRGRGGLDAGDGAHPGADPDRSASPATSSTRRTSSARSAMLLIAGGTPCEYVEIDSPHGHDAFLINLDQLVGTARSVRRFGAATVLTIALASASSRIATARLFAGICTVIRCVPPVAVTRPQARKPRRRFGGSGDLPSIDQWLTS